MASHHIDQIKLSEVSRVFGRTFALHRISLQLQQGQITALAGDNGAGTSTLLNILATTDAPTSGTVHYGPLERDQFAAAHRHHIGWVGHDSLLYSELTARENLLFFARMYGLSSPPARCERWLQKVGLDDAADRRVGAFSRGMKQRLSIARALLHNPQVLLFDEPATGLDQQGTQFVIDLLDELRERQRLILLVTHDFDLLESLFDRLLILRQGSLTCDLPDGDVEHITETYRAHA